MKSNVIFDKPRAILLKAFSRLECGAIMGWFPLTVAA
jgi:hypothetical protein